MDNTFSKDHKVYLDASPISGRGVFAIRDIAQDEIIEVCPMVPLINRSKYQLEPMIWRYCYTKPYCDCADCKKHGLLFFMVLGYGMIYNHQDDNNARMKLNYKELTAEVIALKPIKQGDEIFVNYGPDYFKNIPKVDQQTINPE